MDKNEEFLLEEYRQVYEQFRHCDNISQSKEAIFAVASFGVLALVISKDFSLFTVIGAAAVSLFLYLFHVLASERMSFYTEVAIERLKEIESEINGEINIETIKDNNHENKDNNHENIKKSLCFQTEFKKYYEKEILKRLKKKLWFLNPFYFHSYLKRNIKVRTMQWILTGLLITAWILVFVFNAYKAPPSSPQHWPGHEQTRHYHNR